MFDNLFSLRPEKFLLQVINGNGRMVECWRNGKSSNNNKNKQNKNFVYISFEISQI